MSDAGGCPTSCLDDLLTTYGCYCSTILILKKKFFIASAASQKITAIFLVLSFESEDEIQIGVS